MSPEKKIVGIGYNGFPNGCNDDELPWARASTSGSPLDTKYPVRLPSSSASCVSVSMSLGPIVGLTVESSSLCFLDLQYVCHAEMNAILNKNSTDVKGCTIYVALFPCNECAKLIIQVAVYHPFFHEEYS